MARQSPGTTIREVRKGPVAMTAIGTAIGGFLGIFEKGPLNVPILVTSPDDASEVMGDLPPDSNKFTKSALDDFFLHGGKSCYLVRILGAGHATANRMLNSSVSGAGYGSMVSSANAFPAALEDGDTFIGRVDGGVATTATVVAHRPEITGAGATYVAVTAGSRLNLMIQGHARSVEFTGTEDSLAEYLTAINSQLIDGSAVDSGGQVKLISDFEGSAATASILASSTPSVLAALGLTAGPFTLAPGSNVADASAVTAAELVALFEATFPGSTASAPNPNQFLWVTDTAGVGGSIQLTAGTGVAKVAGFDTVVHAGGADTPVGSLKVEASSPGVWGNRIRVKSVRVDTQVTLLGSVYPAGESHQTFAVISDARILPGDTLSMTASGGDVVRGVVDSVEDNQVTFVDPIIVPAGGLSLVTAVISETLNIFVYRKDGQLLRSFLDLRMSPQSEYYVEARINNARRTPIKVTVQASAALDKRPATDGVAAAMGGGLEGAPPSASDYVGSLSSPKTGLFAFDAAADVNMISVPGITDTAVVRGIEAYGEYREDVLMVIDAPKGYDRDMTKTWRSNTVNLSSSYSVVWFPWLKEADTFTKGVKLVPPSGAFQGVVARTHQRRGFGKAPSGILDGKLVTAVDLEFNIDDIDYDSMYPLGINAVRNFPGEGIVFWGNRTMDASGEFKEMNIRIAMNIIKREVKRRTRFVNFEPNNEKTRAQVRRTLTSYFRSLKDSNGSGVGVLHGSKDSEAFFIVCDETNNTPLVIAENKLVCRIGLAFEHSVEFQEYTLEQDTRAIDKALAGGGDQ